MFAYFCVSRLAAAFYADINDKFIRFINRRRSRKLRALHSTLKSPLPIAGLPVNCCGPTPSPNGPLGSLATLQVYNSHKVNEQEIDSSPKPEKFSALSESENLI